MDEDELDQLLADLEEDVAAEVRNVLTEVADEYARGLDAATELVAARFSVAGIAGMWRQRIPRLVRRLLRVSERASGTAADDVGTSLPDGWDDLPGRYDDDTLPAQLGTYVESTEHLLRAVGDRLADAATRELAEGLNAGEDLDELRARLRAAFDREGAQLGEAREERIAATETTRAWNAATLATAQVVTGPDRPLVKQWRIHNSPAGDDRVREAHRDADGQLRLLDEAFQVGGVPMQYPGDPSAPADLSINCRCVLRLSAPDRTASAPEEAPMDDPETPDEEAWVPPVRTWSTPDGAGLAFENQETGDGRIFTPGALQWADGPWPLMYAGKNLGGHDGSELCGAIDSMARDGHRITGTGPIYTTTPAGFEAEWLLEQGAPLGVSVDLDDVDVEFVSRTGDDSATVAASFASASVLRHQSGAYQVIATTGPKWSAAGTTLVASSTTVEWHIDPDGSINRGSLTAAGITAAAGDPDTGDQGPVVHTESSGDLLMRIVRARVRGATLVSVPAFKDARIVLDPRPAPADAAEESYSLAAAAGTVRERVIAYVRTSPTPVTARDLAKVLDDVDLAAIHRHLAEAVESGHLVRIARGQYVAAADLPEGDISAAADGDPELPTVDDPVPWEDDDMTELEASAWRVVQDMPPMPAEWFQNPIEDGSLTDDSPGVNYSRGRVYGWVAKAGVPHAGYPGKNLVIEKIAREGIDFSHFLRQRFTLDDGSTVKAGAFTMNVGHDQDDKVVCQTNACQYDDTRFVAGIITVGMDPKRGMWFSGAAAPWMADTDKMTLLACQPSYHLQRSRKGWELRAVLSVPVPGHSTALAASAVAERANLALTAAAAVAEVSEYEQQEPEPQHDRPEVDAPAVEAVTAALLSPAFLDRFSAALDQRAEERAAELAALTAEMATIKDEITASAAPTDEEPDSGMQL